MVGINGPEGNNILGSFVEDEIEAFFSNFMNWKLLYKNFDETFLSVDSEDENTRGFDFLYQLFEPFSSESVNHGVIVESKKIKDGESFSKSRLTKDIDTLKSKIEKARNSKLLVTIQPIKTRLLILILLILKKPRNDLLAMKKRSQSPAVKENQITGICLSNINEDGY